ncbi:hypothetical protein [Roseateles cavernae]|uniref:hypothetical protein n=1 Tax=Roseateles cavernae TaxID=3153578 RepID=UPI0032E3CEF3
MVQRSIRDTRQEQLEHLLAEHDGVQVDLAKTLRRPPAQVNHWLTGLKAISEDSARDIERRAQKPEGWLDRRTAEALKQVGTAEPPPAVYAIGSDWPLPGISPHQLRRLAPADRQFVADHIKLVLHSAERRAQEVPNWREVALRLAANADLQDGARDAFTQFCLAVDRQHAVEAARPNAKSKRTKPIHPN